MVAIMVPLIFTLVQSKISGTFACMQSQGILYQLKNTVIEAEKIHFQI